VEDELARLRLAVVELDNVEELKKVFGWKLDPVLDDDSIYEFDSLEDVNLRRVRDAECIGTIVRNVSPSVCVDIGTAEGHSAALMAVNAPQARVVTVNIPPEEIHSGAGGVLTTVAFERDRIGSYYRGRGLSNVEQVLANTATWEPNVGSIDVALVDGCHDTEFVFNDSRKVLAHMSPGSFLLWHDFHPGLVAQKGWIREVCLGVEKLLAAWLVRGQIFHVRNSWLGIYRVPE
jgi:predicted O-methyltransferase YrrM